MILPYPDWCRPGKLVRRLSDGQIYEIRQTWDDWEACGPLDRGIRCANPKTGAEVYVGPLDIGPEVTPLQALGEMAD